jgi:glycosyltransferase involved in cell wall biosynthesis
VTDKIAAPGLRISVVTISRNSSEFIGDTIKSVLSQNYPNIEYIVIDGASTDSTVEIIKSHEEGITKWISEPDKGIADAFNKGLALTTGDYIIFLNSDDALAHPDVIAKIVEEIERNNFPKLIYGDYDVLNRKTSEILYHGSVDFNPARVRFGQVLPQPSLFVHRSYFDKYGSFDTRFRIAMDYEWLLRGILKEKVIHLPWLVTLIRDGGISTIDQRKVIKEIIFALKKNGYFSSRLAEIKMRNYFMIRYFSKKLLTQLGLYNLFFNLRNRLKNA